MKPQHRKGFFASMIAGLAAVSAAKANAQDSDDNVSALEEITVTGSRIRDTGMNTPVPVTMVSADQLGQAAPGNLIEAFDQMPQFMGNSSPGTDVFIGTNAGQSILNMRGLGANRTLVLLDGRRVVPSTKNGTLDINVLPESMIKRVEVVTGGASAAYGTDAVAGVTNFILDTDYTGIKGHVQGGETTRGDGGNKEASLAWGTAIGSRAHLIASVDYYDANAIESYDDRNWMQNWGTVLNPAWSQGSSQPQYLVKPNVTSTLYTFGGMINSPGTVINNLKFLSDGSAVPFQPGSIANFNSTFLRSQTGGVGDNVEADRGADGGLIPNVKRYNGFAHLKYQINDEWEAFGQLITGHNEVDGRGFADIMNGPAFQGTIYSGNPYLPANVQQAMTANNIQSFGLSRIGSSADLGINRLVQSNDMDSYTVGVKGAIGDWRVNSYYQYGRNENEMRAVNFPRTDRLFLALDAVIDPTTRAITCRVNTVQAGIRLRADQPVRLGSRFAGSDRLRHRRHQDGEHGQQAERVRILGRWRDLQELGAGAGVRRERHRVSQGRAASGRRRSEQPDERPARSRPCRGTTRRWASAVFRLASAGVNSGVQFSIVPNFSGEITTKEAFTEVLVPLVKGVTLVKQLNFSGAARYADYSGSGRCLVVEGAVWIGSSSTAFRLRGTVSRDVRAANMSERFDSSGAGATVRDPLRNNTVTKASRRSPRAMRASRRKRRTR